MHADIYEGGDDLVSKAGNPGPGVSRLRAAIWGIVLARPGIHFREIMRLTGASPASVRFQVNKLKHGDMISERKEGQYSRYYPVKGKKFQEFNKLGKRTKRP